MDYFIKLYLKLTEFSESIYSSNIYLDNNATTKPCIDAIISYNKHLYLGNASALYATKCIDIINVTKILLLKCLHLPTDKYTVIFNSCASESINTFFNTMYQYNNNIPIISSSYEHITTLLAINKFNNVTFINPDIYGIVSVDSVNKSILQQATQNLQQAANSVIVNIMQTNNELGSTNNINKKNLLHHNNIIYHVDIVQAFSKYPIVSADAYSISFHKIYGIPGCGALVISNKLLGIFAKYAQIKGHQNDHLRGGTENIAMIASINATLTSTFNNRVYKNNELLRKKNIIIDTLYKNNNVISYAKFYATYDTNFDVSKFDKHEIIIVIIETNSINTILLSVLNINNKILQLELLKRGVIVSIGSACSKGSKSHVLESIKAPKIIINGALRISIGDNNTDHDCYNFCYILNECLNAACGSVCGAS